MSRTLWLHLGTFKAGSSRIQQEAWNDPYAGAALTEMLTALRTADVVDDVRGVLYLRNRFDYARSLYREMTRRRSNALPLHEYVELPRRRRMLNPLAVIRSLTKSLAPGSLEVYPYEGAGDTGQHFFDLLGLTAAAQTRPVNTSLDALEVEAYRQLKQVAPELEDRWSGLYHVTPREQWPTGVTEQFGPDQLAIEQGWRRHFRRLTGWSRDEVDKLLDRPADSGSDVLTYSDDLRRLVGSWARCQ